MPAAVAPNNFAALGLQQDDQGVFSPIAGFGNVGGGRTAAEIAAMSDADLKTMMLTGVIDSSNMANEANLGLLAEQLNTLGAYGTSARGDIRDVFTQERARSTQSLQSRGLAGTTAVGAESAGLAGREARAYTRLDESVAQNKMAVLSGANFQQPNVNQLYNQMLQAGQSGMGQGAPNQAEWWQGPALGGVIDATGQLIKYALRDDEASTTEQAVGAVEGVAALTDVLTPPPGSVDFSLPDTGVATVGGPNAGYQGIEGGGFAGPSTAGTAGLTDTPSVRGQSPDGGEPWYSEMWEGVSEAAEDVWNSIEGFWDWAVSNPEDAAGKAGAGASGKAALAQYGSPGLLATLGTLAPWIAVGVGAYFVYRNNKDKVDNLYDDAEEYVKDAYDDTEERVKKGIKDAGKSISRSAKSLEDKAKERARKWGIKF